MPFYRDNDGIQLGWYVGTAPSNGIECAAPASAEATWNGQSWDEPAPPPVLVPFGTIVARIIIQAGGFDGLIVLLQQLPNEQRSELLARFFAAREGVYNNDQDAINFFTAAGLDPAVILA